MEITIYNKKGIPCAYLATDNDNTIYLWNRQPVAYLDNENIYGLNGKHLGWFKRKRVMYDKNGLRIGFTTITCPSAIQVKTKKSAKKTKPEKTAKLSIRYGRPRLIGTILNNIPPRNTPPVPKKIRLYFVLFLML